MTTFAGRLKELREKHELTMTEASELIGVPYQTYRNWENEGKFPRPAGLRKIAAAYGIESKSLLIDDKPEEKTESIEQPKKDAIVEENVNPKDNVTPTRSYTVYETPHRQETTSIRYHSKDAQALQDVNTVINQIKYMNIGRDKKKSIHKTMSEFRMNLECKVFYGDDL